MHPVLPVYRANWFKHLDEFKPSIFVEPVTCLKASLFIHSYCVFMPIKRLLTSQHIRLSSCFSYDHRFSGTLGVGVGWQWVTDLSGQPIWPNFKCQSFEQDRLFLIKSRFEATFIGTSSCAERSNRRILWTCSIIFVLILSIVYNQPTKCTKMFMMYFIYTFLANMFRPLLLPSSGWYYYKNTKVQMWLVVSLSLHKN